MEDKEISRGHQHNYSQQSIESELGGHEQLKTVLLDEDDKYEYFEENVKVAESVTMIRESGGNFLYQKLILIGLIIPALAVFYAIPLMPKMSTIPDLLCSTEAKGDFQPCTVDTACSYGEKGYTVNSKTSYVNWLYDFGLLCQSTPYLKIIYYFFFVGFIIGSIFIASLADYIGRKKVLLLSTGILCILYLKFVFTTDAVGAGIVLFLIGAAAGSYYCTTVAYLTEIVLPESAVIYSVMFHLSFPLSGALVEVMLKWLADWKIITTIMALAPLILIIYFTHMAESPRYLASKEDYALAKVAANTISYYNIGRMHHWDFFPDPSNRCPGHLAFTEKRNHSLFQHCILLNYTSSKTYLAFFGLLLFATGFTFSGLALAQKQIFADPFNNAIALYGVEFIMIFFTAFFVRILGHLRSTYFALVVTGITGILSGLMIWLSDSVQGVMVYLMKLFSLMAFVASISLSAEVCAPRLRATGFGLTVSMGTIGLICGGLVLEIYGKTQIVFGIVALVSVFFVNWVGKLSAYSTMDDIYEVVENYRKIEKQDENVIPMVEKTTKPKSLSFSLEGTRIENNKEIDLEIESVKISMKGEISWDGQDKKGKYSLSGSVKDGGKIIILKKYGNGSSIKYDGELTNNEVKGEYEANSKSGKFSFKFKDRYWVGEFEKDESKKRIEWILCQNYNKICGLGKVDKIVVFISGTIENENELKLEINDEDGSEERFEGQMNEGRIKGKLNGLSIELSDKS